MRHVSGLANAKRRGALRSWSLAAAIVAAAAGPASAAELTKLRALIPIPNLDESFAPVAVAKVLGYFQQEGLDVSIITVSGSNEAAIQVSAGNAEVALASPADARAGGASNGFQPRGPAGGVSTGWAYNQGNRKMTFVEETVEANIPWNVDACLTV